MTSFQMTSLRIVHLRFASRRTASRRVSTVFFFCTVLALCPARATGGAVAAPRVVGGRRSLNTIFFYQPLDGWSHPGGTPHMRAFRPDATWWNRPRAGPRRCVRLPRRGRTTFTRVTCEVRLFALFSATGKKAGLHLAFLQERFWVWHFGLS